MVKRSRGMARYPVSQGRSAPWDRSKASTPSSPIRSRTRAMRTAPGGHRVGRQCLHQPVTGAATDDPALPARGAVVGELADSAASRA